MYRKQTHPGEILTWLFVVILAVLALTGCLDPADPAGVVDRSSDLLPSLREALTALR